MLLNDADGIGRIEVTTLRLPDFVQKPSGTYLCSGNVLVDYHRAEDPAGTIRLAVTNDKGEQFREIFAGVIHESPKANGVRFMPFTDGKRVLLGHYVLECSPGIDNCETARLIPVSYPWGLDEDSRVFKTWSEIIISPDNEHICWTSLMAGFNGAVNAIGKLVRTEECYVIQDPVIISDTCFYQPDPTRPGYAKPKAVRGGEVKQFVKGGTAISLAGAGSSALPDSVVQDLLSDEIIQITRVPGYEETTIFSPDETLGIVMSTRASARTNFAVLGLLPRPNAMLATSSLIMNVYLFAVSDVRRFRAGNVGPVLIEIDKSVGVNGYIGVPLNDPEGQWVYCSPMSWHPGGKKVMWPEILRGGAETRLRIAELLDYTPKASIPPAKTPDFIPYAEKGPANLFQSEEAAVEVRFAGKAAGYILYKKEGSSVSSEYCGYSDDGESFWNGREASGMNEAGEKVYEADIELTGAQKGAMKCRLTFDKTDFIQPVKLLFEDGADNKPKSYGFAEYGDVVLKVQDMEV